MIKPRHNCQPWLKLPSHFLHSCLSAMINWSLSQKIYFPSLQWLLLNFFVQKEFETISILGTNKYKLRKTQGTFVISTFKVDYIVPLVCLIFYLLVPKIESCLKYFLDKNPQKQLKCSLLARRQMRLLWPQSHYSPQKTNSQLFLFCGGDRQFIFIYH